MSDKINIEGLSRAVALFAEKIQKVYNDFFFPLAEWIEKNGDTLIKISEAISDVSLAVNAAECLGKNQLVFWDEIDRSLANQLLSTSSVDDTMLNFYQKESFAHVDDTIALCLDCKLISNKRNLFLQTVSAYKEEKFNLAIIGFMSIIDGVISEASSDTRTTFKGKLDKIKNKITLEQALSKDELSFLVFSKTIEETYNTMFCFSDFNKVEPSMINRHWITHGRTTREYKKIDCIKVLNMLYGIILIDELSRNEEENFE